MAITIRSELFRVIEENTTNQITELVLKENLESFGKIPHEIGSLTDLKNLTINNTGRVKDISALAELKKLEELTIKNSFVVDITPLNELKNLHSLHLNRIGYLKNDIEKFIFNIDQLKTLKQLKALTLTSYNILDISPLAELKKLEDLRLNKNKIQDISPLSNLTQLIRLDLAENLINNIQPLINLTELYRLNLNFNKVSDISPLQFLRKLNFLELIGNQIRDIPTCLIEVIEGLHNNGFIDSNPLKYDFKNKNTVQILKILYEKINQSFYKVKVSIPNEIRNAIHKYLFSFKEYVEKTKGKEIYFEILENEEGLEVKTKPNENTPIEEIQIYLNEYISLINQDELKIEVKSEMTPQQYETMILDFKNDIAHFKNALEIAKIKNQNLVESKEEIQKLFVIALTNPNPIIMATNENKLENIGNSTNTNTQTNNQTVSINQSFNFEAFEKALPKLQRQLDFLKDELKSELVGNTTEESKKMLNEVEKLIEKSNEVEKVVEAKDEKAIKKSSFWERLGIFAKSVYSWGKTNLNPENLKNLKKTIKDAGQIGEACGITTGIDYENLGAE